MKMVLLVILVGALALGLIEVSLAETSTQTPESHSGGMIGGGQMGQMMPMMQMMQACTQMMQQMSAMMGQHGTSQPQPQQPDKK